MVGKMWALQSCKHQCYEESDRLSQLPDELLLLILSFLAMKEIARTSVLSRKWNYMWRRFPVLIFEDSSSMKRMFKDYDFIPEERSNFLHFGIKNPPAMTNLRHLELKVFATSGQSLLGWVDLIEASPLLQRLTMNFEVRYERCAPKIVRQNGRPLKSLKTLELNGHVGLPIDLEFATYVIKNSVMLKDVIVKILPMWISQPGVIGVDDQVANLMRIVPQDVNFTLEVKRCRRDLDL